MTNPIDNRYMVVVARPRASATLVIIADGAFEAARRGLEIADARLPNEGSGRELAANRWRVVAVFGIAAADMLAGGAHGDEHGLHHGCIYSDPAPVKS